MTSLAIVLGAAVDAARRAVDDLDADQVPADLRKVAAYRGGRLPPPLARSLLKALHRYAWLREKALEAWPEADPDAAGPSRLAARFLARPDGWDLELAEASLEAGRQSAAGGDDGLRREAERLRRDLEASRRKLKDQQAAAADERRVLAAELDRVRGELKSIKAGESRRDRGSEQRAAAVAAELAGVRDELGRVREELGAAREAAKLERRRRADLEQASAADGDAWAGDPILLGRRIDELVAMSQPEGAAEVAVPPPSAVPALPVGVRPDTAAAIDWVIGSPGRRRLLVDGYNAGLQLAPGLAAAEVRERLHPVLERVARLADPGLVVTVVWDTSDGDGEAVRTGSVEVRFPKGGRTADDEIVALVAGDDGPTVVVSSDRDVRERSERGGALALWSEALVAWESRRR